MAKWGEGDPRWIVEERPDATNVNNWHWTEKEASQWSKDKLTDLLLHMKLEDNVGKCEITEVTSCEGEAAVHNRKAKLIFIYDWVIKLKWNGYVAGSSEEVNGSIEIPNLSEEHDPKDVDVNVTVKASGKESEILKEFMRTKGAEQIRQAFGVYRTSLKEEYSQGLILPTKGKVISQNSTVAPTKPAAPVHEKSEFSPQQIWNLDAEIDIPFVRTPLEGKKHQIIAILDASGYYSSRCLPQDDLLYFSASLQEKYIQLNSVKRPGVTIDTTTLTMTESFKCTAEEFYNAMTIKEMVQAFTQGPAVLELEKGGKFQLFGGNINGSFLELVPNKRIKQTWRSKSWPDAHYSEVCLDIVQKEDCTEVKLTQTGVPKSELEVTKNGWKNYYWQNMKRVFGFGALLI